MSIEADIAAFNAKLDAALAQTMETEVFAEARDSIIVSVFENVYDKYTPQGENPYERRYENGGLADPRNIERVDGESGPIPNGYQITLANMTEGIDGDGPIHKVIEEGYGYGWENSRIYQMQPYPRPFYRGAELFLEKNGFFESALKRGLQRAGFTF